MQEQKPQRDATQTKQQRGQTARNAPTDRKPSQKAMECSQKDPHLSMSSPSARAPLSRFANATSASSTGGRRRLHRHSTDTRQEVVPQGHSQALRKGPPASTNDDHNTPSTASITSRAQQASQAYQIHTERTGTRKGNEETLCSLGSAGAGVAIRAQLLKHVARNLLRTHTVDNFRHEPQSSDVTTHTRGNSTG